MGVSKKMVLKSDRTEGMDRVGMALEERPGSADQPHRIVVAEVLPGSVAERRGIQIGDEVRNFVARSPSASAPQSGSHVSHAGFLSGSERRWRGDAGNAHGGGQDADF